MLKQVINTVGTNIIMGGVSFLMMLCMTRYLGAEGKGEVSLLILNITVVAMFNNLVGGPSLIFLVPRLPLTSILLPSYLWALVASLLVSTFLYLFEFLSAEYFVHTIIIALIQSITTIHFMVLIGKEKVTQRNYIFLIQGLLLLGIFAFALLLLDRKEPFSYVIALYLANGIALLLSFIAIIKHIRNSESSVGFLPVIKQLIKYGILVQVANFAQLMNYRLSFYFLEKFAPDKASGLEDIGIYSTGVQLSEAFWMITKSLSLVQYSYISNQEDENLSQELTVTLLKFSFLIVLCLIIPALLLPAKFYALFLGNPEFAHVKPVMVYMSLGIVAFSVSGIVSHYFAGIGMHRINARASSIGLVVTVGLGLILIPSFGITGAAITTSISYVVITIYQLIVYIKKTGISPSELRIGKKDIHYIRCRVNDYLGKNKPNP